MNKGPANQKGASAIVTLILLVVIGLAAYVGIQYVPQAIESKSIDSILDTMQSSQRVNPVRTVQAAETKLVGLLQINEMNDMTDNFKVEQKDGGIVVTFSYDRELNLIYKKHPMHYEKSLRIR
jgi:flagellar basal body-associated protein FliL